LALPLTQLLLEFMQINYSWCINWQYTDVTACVS